MKSKNCPVCGWDIKGGGINVKVGRKTIAVCCDDCAEKTKGRAAKYVGLST
jgi:ribosome-binding protein aMBF1 (putative translation factor)